jgi:glyoxylase-like metal-dependent hydrolase (beta-lactamase superfamily II)
MSLSYPHPDAPPVGSVTPIAGDVYWVRLPLPFAPDHINVWLLRDGDGWTLVDSGLGTGHARGTWEAIFAEVLDGSRLRRIIVTHHHPDHAGLARWLAERFEVEVWISAPELAAMRGILEGDRGAALERMIDFYGVHGFTDAKAIEEILDGADYRSIVSGVPGRVRDLEDGDLIDIGAHAWRVIMTRGHAHGHCCLYSDALGLLISGDQVLPTISTNVSVLPWSASPDPLADYLHSFEALGALPEQTLVLPSHGLAFVGLHARLDALARHHDKTFAKVTAICAEPGTAYEIAPKLYARPLEGFNVFLAIGETLAHLTWLHRRGRMERSETGEGVRWRASGA